MYQVTAETHYDLININLLLNKADVIVKQSRLLKRSEFETKKDAKAAICYVRVSNIARTRFTSFSSLEVFGQFKGHMLKKIIRLDHPFVLCRRLTRNDIKYLRNLDDDRTYYMGVDTEAVIVGYSKNYCFHEIYRKQFSFRKTDLKKLLSVVLRKFDEVFKNRSVIYKCPSQFVKEFNSWTNRVWAELKRDLELDWQSSVNNKIREQKMIRYFVTRRTRSITETTQLQQAIEMCFIKNLFVSAKIDLVLYNHLVRIMPEKLKLVPYTKDLDRFMPEGFIGFSYF